jgi:UDP-N-acetylglucosamine 2-epimerase (non-hydrolysing)
MNAINSIAEQFQQPIIYSTHPRSWKKIEERKIKFHPLVKQVKPFGFFDYNHLQMNSTAVLSDSGTLSEESSILKFPGILIRTSTERPEVLDKGSVLLGGITEIDIIQCIELAKNMMGNNENILLSNDYVDENVSIKIIKIIQSYTKMINKNVWNKQEKGE